MIFYDYYADIPEQTLREFVSKQELGRLVSVNSDGQPHVGLYPFLFLGESIEMHLHRADEQLADLRATLPAQGHGLEISVSGKQKMRGDAFEESGTVLERIRPADKVEQRMCIALCGAVIEHETQRPDALGDHPHRPVDDGVAGIALSRKSRIVA